MRNVVPLSRDGELLDAVIDAAASLIVVADPDGRLVRWNRACEQLLGYTQAEVDDPGALLHLVPEAERGVAEAARRALVAGRSPIRTEFHWRTREGRLRLIEWTITALAGPEGRKIRP